MPAKKLWWPLLLLTGAFWVFGVLVMFACGVPYSLVQGWAGE